MSVLKTNPSELANTPLRHLRIRLNTCQNENRSAAMFHPISQTICWSFQRVSRFDVREECFDSRYRSRKHTLIVSRDGRFRSWSPSQSWNWRVGRSEEFVRLTWMFLPLDVREDSRRFLVSGGGTMRRPGARFITLASVIVVTDPDNVVRSDRGWR